MLEVEDVEDVACTVYDVELVEAMDHSQFFDPEGTQME
jgi:hypothetical protein